MVAQPFRGGSPSRAGRVDLRRKAARVPRTIFAFNGDLESRLALHWLVHERGCEVIALSVNIGQGIDLEPLGELALELGAAAAKVVDRRDEALRDFALPSLQANAVSESRWCL